MKERLHILKILKGVKIALKNRDYIKIKNLSNHLIHHSSIHQDPDIISVTIIIYALSKLIEREDYKNYPEWPNFYKQYIKCIDNLIRALEKDNLEMFRNEIKLIRNSIQKLSGKLKIYIDNVFRKAKVNKASRIYEHGISMEKTAEILGISIWELAEYAGQTRIGDINLSITLHIKQRIKTVEEIFNDE